MKRIYIIVLIFCCLLFSTTIAKTIYVDINATGNNDGTSWEDAFNSMYDAVDDAGPVGDTIIVAPGVYTAGEGYEPLKFDKKEIHLRSKDPHNLICRETTVIDGTGLSP